MRAWQKPSPRVRELIRRGAERALNAPPEWFREIEHAMLSSESMKSIADDPVLAAATRRTNRANLLHWAAANVTNPGEPVPANLSSETLAVARELVRRGVNAAVLDGYRLGQNAAWVRWMTIAFELSSDPRELRELLDVSARSISSFVDATLAGIAAQMEVERDALTRGTHAERRELVTLILEGAPVSPSYATHRLRYNLEQAHRAAIVWCEEAESDLGLLESAANALARSAGVQHPLMVATNAATLWMWMPAIAAPDLSQVNLVVRELPGIRVAVGSLGQGVEGFRRSHVDALTTQRLLSRLRSDQRVASIDNVRLVSLITQDPEAADRFVKHVLGELEAAAPQLQQALRAFLAEGCNVTRTAARLYTHRNTLLRRLARAQALLPQPLEQHRLDVAAALEVLRWRAGGG